MRQFFATSTVFRMSVKRLAFSYSLLGIWTFIVLFPLYWLVITAFKLPLDVNSGPRYVPFVDFQPSMHAWEELLGVNAGIFVLRPYFNTIFVGVNSALISLFVGAFAAYALTRFEYQPKVGLIVTFIGCVGLVIVLMAAGLPWQLAVASAIAVYVILAQTIGRRFKKRMKNEDIAFWLISQRMLPPVTVIIPIYMLFQALGMLDTREAIIVAYCAANLPIVIWFMRDYFQTIPIALEESALIDGASRFDLLFRIVLPLSVPGLVATFLIILVFSWNEYIMALFLSGAETQTMPLLVSAQNATRGPQWWNISVLVMLMVGPIVLMAIVLERFIAKGLLIGAVKG
jgi:multiple sugar transport system permease protein